jgi:hypothetical protein
MYISCQNKNDSVTGGVSGSRIVFENHVASTNLAYTALTLDEDKAGIGTLTPNEALTVVGNISATGSLYGNGSNLTGIVAGDSVATTLVRTNSANWDSAYLNQTKFLPLSGGSMTGRLSAAADAASAKLNIGNAITGGSSNPTDTINGDIWINSGSRLAYKSNSSVYTLALTNTPNTFTTTQSIDLSSNTVALRITQKGNGEAIRVEDDITPDSTAFIVGSDGTVGIGLNSLSGIDAKLTVVGNISATGIISASATNIKVNVVNDSTNRIFTDNDNNKVIHIDTTTTSLCAIFPSSLSSGFNVAIMNTGTNNLVLSAAQLNSAGTTISTRYGGAFVYKDSTSLFAVGKLV